MKQSIYAVIIILYSFIGISYAVNAQDSQLLVDVQLLLDAKRYQQAADILERELMLDSSNVLVLKKYKLVLKLIGDSTQAIEQVIQSNNWYDSWLIQRKLSLFIGGSDNLNKATSSEYIDITFASSDSFIQLDKESQAKSGYGLEVGAGFEASKQWRKDDWLNLALNFTHRNTSERNFTDYYHLAGSIGWLHKLNTRQNLETKLFIESLEYDNKVKFYSINFLSRYSIKHKNNCQMSIGTDIHWHRQDNGTVLSELYAGGLLETNCYWGNSLYSAALKIGNQWALIDNPGQDQLQLSFLLGQRSILDFLVTRDELRNYIGMTYTLDETGYSDFLAHGAKRNSQRLSLGSQYRLPIMKNKPWWLVIKLEWQKQFSNLALFDFEAFEGWVGIEVIW